MGTSSFSFPRVFLCHQARLFATNKSNGMETSTKGESTMKTLLTIIRLVARIAAVILVSPTDGAFVDRYGFGRAYLIRTKHGRLCFSWREVL